MERTIELVISGNKLHHRCFTGLQYTSDFCGSLRRNGGFDLIQMSLLSTCDKPKPPPGKLTCYPKHSSGKIFTQSQQDRYQNNIQWWFFCSLIVNFRQLQDLFPFISLLSLHQLLTDLIWCRIQPSNPVPFMTTLNMYLLN